MTLHALMESPGWSLRALSLPLRVLLTCFLATVGIGYLAALLYLFLTDVEPHQKMGMGVIASITSKYYGARDGSRLEASLRGVMADKVSTADRDEIVRWLRGGASKEAFGAISPIFAKNCMTCHSASTPPGPLAPLTTYEEVSKFAQIDAGPSFSQLARVSHVHLFGISIVFLLTGAIFAMSGVPLALRVSLLVLPYLAIWIDIGSWWITKYAPAFAYTVLAGGVLMSISFATQILVSLWDMWLGKPPQVVGPMHKSEAPG